MNDDELKKLWQQQPLRNPDVSPGQLVSAMKRQTTQLRSIVDARDVRELVACGVLIIIFGFFYFTVYRDPIPRVGDLIIIGSLVFIAWKLVHTRRSTPPAPRRSPSCRGTGRRSAGGSLPRRPSPCASSTRSPAEAIQRARRPAFKV